MGTDKLVVATGKRKVAKARATIRKGTGIVRVNKLNLDSVQPRYFRMAVETPLVIAGEIVKTVDIDVNVNGGGVTGQKDAIQQAISRALLEWTNNDTELKKKFIAYNRNLVVFDSRKNEPSKFSRSAAGPRRKRQSSKR